MLGHRALASKWVQWSSHCYEKSVLTLILDPKWTILDNTDCPENDLKFEDNIASIDACLAEC